MNETTAVWLGAAPPRRLESEKAVLFPPGPGDVEALVVAADESLHELQPWMPWAAGPATTRHGRVRAGKHGAAVPPAAFIYLMHDRAPGPGPIIGGCGLHARLGCVRTRFF
jgi:hypothetical protein